MTDKWIKLITGDLVRWSSVNNIHHWESDSGGVLYSYCEVNGYEKDFLPVESLNWYNGVSYKLDLDDVITLNRLAVQYITLSDAPVLCMDDVEDIIWVEFVELWAGAHKYETAVAVEP